MVNSNGWKKFFRQMPDSDLNRELNKANTRNNPELKAVMRYGRMEKERRMEQKYREADKLDSASKKRSSRLYKAEQKRMKKRRVKRQPRSNNFGLGSLSLGSSNLSRMRFF